MANAFAILGRNTTKPMQADLADLQAQKAATRVNLSHAKLYEQQAAKAEADAKAEQETINAFKQMGMNPTPEAIAQLSTVNPLAAQRMQSVVSKQAQDKLEAQKAEYDAAEAQLKAQKTQMEMALGKGAALSQIMSTVENPAQLFGAAERALQAGALTPEQALQMVQMPWEQFVQQKPQIVQMGQTIKERLTLAEQEFKNREAEIKSKRDALLFPVELATKQAGQTVAQNQAVTTAPNAQGLTPAQAASNEIAKSGAQRQAEQLMETKRHNQAMESNAAARLAKEGSEGKPLQEGGINKLEMNKAVSDRLGSLSASFKNEYSGNLTGGAENFIGKLGGESLGLVSEGQTDWWQNYQDYLNEVRNKLFGSALTPTEQREFEKATISPSSAPSVVKTNLARQKQIIDAALNRRADAYEAGGFNQKQVGIFRPGGKDAGASGPAPSSVREIIRGADGKLVFKK